MLPHWQHGYCFLSEHLLYCVTVAMSDVLMFISLRSQTNLAGLKFMFSELFTPKLLVCVDVPLF